MIMNSNIICLRSNKSVFPLVDTGNCWPSTWPGKRSSSPSRRCPSETWRVACGCSSCWAEEFVSFFQAMFLCVQGVFFNTAGFQCPLTLQYVVVLCLETNNSYANPSLVGKAGQCLLTSGHTAAGHCAAGESCQFRYTTFILYVGRFLWTFLSLYTNPLWHVPFLWILQMSKASNHFTTSTNGLSQWCLVPTCSRFCGEPWLILIFNRPKDHKRNRRSKLMYAVVEEPQRTWESERRVWRNFAIQNHWASSLDSKSHPSESLKTMSPWLSFIQTSKRGNPHLSWRRTCHIKKIENRKLP